MMICNSDSDCDAASGELCLYGPEGVHRVCKREQCGADAECREGKKCVRTRWYGKQ